MRARSRPARLRYRVILQIHITPSFVHIKGRGRRAPELFSANGLFQSFVDGEEYAPLSSMAVPVCKFTACPDSEDEEEKVIIINAEHYHCGKLICQGIQVVWAWFTKV